MIYTFLIFFIRAMKLHRTRHSCVKTSGDSAEKTNVVWEPSKDLKHLKLKFLLMIGSEEEDMVTNYIRLVMERAVGLKRVMLQSQTCKDCDAMNLKSPKTSQAEDEVRKHRIKERLTRGSSSAVKIIIR
uniref:Uncharacterized protein n=1 Tax=Avena sativa TaxID=4498 RepID=A0ACD5WJT6_AVESA